MGARGLTLGAALGLGAALACHRAFVCDADAQCQLDGQAGRCEATGSCSFPDGSCPSGHRYGEHAALELAEQCVEVPAGSDSTATDDASGSTGASDNADTGVDTTVDTTADTGIDTDPECPPLRDSGPVVVTADDQIVEGLRITAEGVPGITVSGHRGVVIRDCEIHHAAGPGISFAAADDLTIDTVVVVHDRTEPGPHADANQVNITGTSSTGLTITRVRVTRGASGIELTATPGAILQTIEGHDVRGPGPPASFIHLTDSSDVLIEDFSCINPLDTGRPGNLVDIHESSGVIVRDGLLDGHNGEFGYGVLFNQTSGQHAGGVVEDVDAVRMTNGAFSGFPTAYDLEFRRTRARQNICEIVSVPIDDCSDPGPMGGCIPGSQGRSWAGAPELSGLLIEDSAYFDLCIHPVWPESAFTTCDGDGSTLPPGDCGLVEEDFELRPPTRVLPCWES